jgi:hypothetical protein
MRHVLAIGLLASIALQVAPALAATTKCKTITSQSTCNNTGTCTWHTRKGICIPK